MIKSLQKAEKTDLLPLAYALSDLTFKKKDEQLWLKERFKRMEDILEESWAYQEMVQKGVAKGLEQGKKDVEQIVIRFVELHFPDLVPLARQQATQTATSQQLQELLDKLFVAHTDKQAKAILLGEQQ